MKSRASRALMILGLVAMVIGAIDPLEGSVVILAGSLLAAMGALLGAGPRNVQLTAFGLVAVGVAALFALSSVGGVGGRTGRSGPVAAGVRAVSRRLAGGAGRCDQGRPSPARCRVSEGFRLKDQAQGCSSAGESPIVRSEASLLPVEYINHARRDLLFERLADLAHPVDPEDADVGNDAGDRRRAERVRSRRCACRHPEAGRSTLPRPRLRGP